MERIAQQSEILNANINDLEISRQVKGLQSGKSTYLDEILNEALKTGYEELKRPLVHIFNIIYSHGVYPDNWCDGYIIPIHKKNDVLSANNYRGIIISSCIGKLFLRVVAKRMDEFMTASCKWCVNQCGFKSDHRTEDILFIINTLFDSYITQQNKVVCSICRYL